VVLARPAQRSATWVPAGRLVGAVLLVVLLVPAVVAGAPAAAVVVVSVLAAADSLSVVTAWRRTSVAGGQVSVRTWRGRAAGPAAGAEIRLGRAGNSAPSTAGVVLATTRGHLQAAAFAPRRLAALHGAAERYAQGLALPFDARAWQAWLDGGPEPPTHLGAQGIDLR